MAPRQMIKPAGRPEEVASAIAFLLSDDASYVTGTQLASMAGGLHIDGRRARTWV
jgi:NAD(P)-dependent dehydrogenase (short-subunit alcohol dehydrogenase family)